MSLPLEALERLYDLELSVFEKVSGGYLSENYALADGDTKYFLKKHRHKDEQQVKGVCLAEDFFAEGGVPVILPLPTKWGDSLFEHAGSFYSLYPFVNGRHIERGKLSEKAAVSLGETLARIHKRGKESTLPISERFNAWDTEKFLRKAALIEAEIAGEKPTSEFGTLTLENLRLKKDAISKNTVTYEDLSLPSDHLIHGDYFCDNVFFGEEGRVSSVFDFEKTQYAPPLYELFRSMFVSFFSIPSEGNLLIAKKYVDAYLAVYPFPKDLVRRSLTAACLKQIHSIWIEEEHYLKHSTRPDDLLPSQYALNKFYLGNRKAIEEFLLG